MAGRWARAAATGLLPLLALLVVWELAVRLLHVSPNLLPAPSLIIATIAASPAAYAAAVEATLLETVIGIIAGAAIGVASGIVFSRVKLLERMFFPLLVASQAVPIIAFGAIVVIWFGNGLASKAFIALYLTFFPVAVNTLRGLRAVPPQQIGLLRTFGASATESFLKLQFPAALPAIFTALRLGASLGLVGAIVGEWFGASVGLGATLLLSMYNYQMPQLWAAIFLTGLSGTVLFWIIVAVENRLAWWQEEL